MPLSKEKKRAYVVKMNRILSSYTKVFVVEVENVGSSQMNTTRAAMRGKAEILMGKNTLMRKIIKDFQKENPDHVMANILDLIEGNVGYVFTNDDLPPIRDLILANKVPAPARPNAVAPIDVSIPAGPTGCDPGQTSFFQTLQVPTKIMKGQIEITNSMDLIKKGEKVGYAEAALLEKLKIRPFSYGLEVNKIFDNGSVFGVEVLDITPEILQARFMAACRKVAAISLEIGFPTQAALPHTIGNCFKSLVAVAVGLDNYTFKEAQPFKDFLANPSAFASAAPAAGAATDSKPVEAGPAEEEVDALDGGMDMFGGGGGGGGDY